MLPWQIYQSYLSVRSRFRDVISLTYDVIEVERYHSWALCTIHPKYSTEMHQNTTFYAELNGEHAGEGFMPLRQIVLMLSTREVEKSWNWRKFDLWPAITGSNIDLGPKIIPPIASTRREQSAGLFREALRRFVWKRQGGGRTNPPPLHRRRWQNMVYGRGLKETSQLRYSNLSEIAVLLPVSKNHRPRRVSAQNTRKKCCCWLKSSAGFYTILYELI